MDRRFKLSLLGAAAIAAAQFSGAVVSSASAADLLPPPPIVQAPEIVQQSNTGWYLRGDISYDFQKVKGYQYNTYAVQDIGTPLAPLNIVKGDTQHFKEFDLEDAFNLGLGIGYQVTNNLRVDLTGDYVFHADMNGKSCVNVVVDAAAATGSCGSPDGAATHPSGNIFGDFVDTTEVSRIDVLANAYADLGTFGSITPYVGAGIGGSYVQYGTLLNNAPGTDGDQTHDGLSNWRFAYALHAGAAYSISNNLKLDIGYTYKHIEGGASHKNGNKFPSGGTQTIAGTTSPFIYDKGFDSHTIKAGLRYQFGGGNAHH